jgi:hypothetical protein
MVSVALAVKTDRPINNITFAVRIFINSSYVQGIRLTFVCREHIGECSGQINGLHSMPGPA